MILYVAVIYGCLVNALFLEVFLPWCILIICVVAEKQTLEAGGPPHHLQVGLSVSLAEMHKMVCFKIQHH